MAQELVAKGISNTSTEPLSDDSARTLFDEERISIVVIHRAGAETAPLGADRAVVVGRGGASDLCIADRTLSREHARFALVDGRVSVEDLGSTNGVWVAGERVRQAVLEVGGEVMLGSLVARVQSIGGVGARLGLEGEGSFRRHLDDEVLRAKHFRRRFALIAVRAADGEPVGRWAPAARAALRSVDRIGVYSAAVALVLLPEVDLEAAREAACAVAAGGRLAGVASFPDAAATAEELIEVARRALGRAAPGRPVEVASTAAWVELRERAGGEPIVAGAAMRGVLETAARVAAARIPIILQGETGTGKEVLARFIHEHGPRRDRRMVRVNCGAIPAQLVESTLFGHEKGAFTGAVQQQRGVFEEADKGTVFLDEIGELPPAAQVALLRVLETGAFCRVGSAREIAADVRVIAATHRDLEAMAAEGAFREDLYYRLSTMVIELPPLRERADAIEPLALRFLEMANTANGRHVRWIAPEALELLRAHRWPGNVRELKNAIDRAVVVAQGDSLFAEDLPARVRAAGEGARHAEDGPEPPAGPVGPEGRAKVQVQSYEARLLEEALRKAGWDRAEAARRLGMPVRTLSYRMKVLGLKKPER
ncbi:sigma 54-interacting transcriptional regulator [Sorangium sp. So ce291]|uniref:sigma 54-interacting transcriptional regulator n=1 Tax=Sorangium sp. So ce291 TaxID=3133294 RepID=UPI003F5EC8C6